MYGTLKKIFAFAGSKEGLLKKSLLFAFLSGLFAALQFAALFIVVEALVSDNRDSRFIWISLGIMAVSLVGRIITTYFSTMEQTETGYCMVAEKRIHIGDRLRYIPMGYFNKNSIGNITAIVTTTLGDVENSAARVLVSVLGGFFNSVALVIVLLVFDWRIGLIAAIGVLLYLAAAELALRKSARLSGVRQHTQESLVESVLEYIQGMGIVKAFGMEKDSTQSIDSVIKASCRDNLKLTKASVPYDALKQVVVRVFSVLLLLASIYFWLNGSLSLAYGVILVIASFMVFNDLENAGNMASLLQMLAASMDTANSIDDTPVMDEKGADVVPASSEIIFDNVDFSYADRKILDHVSFTVHAGEIFGIAGVSGNGQDELCDLIAGSRTASAGQILLDGTDITNASIRARIEAGLGYVPVDRYRDGMVMDMTLAENMFLKSSFSARWARHGVINRKALEAFTAEQIQEHRVKAGGPGDFARSLSGGNQQKVVLAREVDLGRRLLVFNQPTRGLDMGAVDRIHKVILQERESGKAVLMISTELSEIFALCDRIAVMYKGRMMGIYENGSRSAAQIGLLMAGISEEQEGAQA